MAYFLMHHDDPFFCQIGTGIHTFIQRNVPYYMWSFFTICPQSYSKHCTAAFKAETKQNISFYSNGTK